MRIIQKHPAGQTNMTLSRSWKCQRCRGLLAAISFFSLFHSPVQAAQSVTFAWDPSPDPIVVGYNIYSGVASSTYTNKVDVGNLTSGSISGLSESVTYFFAVTAYDANELESDFSDELSFTVPKALPDLEIHAAIGGWFILPLTGHIGNTYDIEATEGFTNWTVIGTVTLGPSGAAEFIDTNTMRFPKRFYRTHQKP